MLEKNEKRDSVENELWASLEAQELERRWPVALRELKALLDRVRDIRPGNAEKLHDAISHVEKVKLRDALVEALTTDDKPELKRTVIRKMANKIGDYLFWRRETTTPVIHELLVLLPWWISQLKSDAISKVREIGLEYILNGRVVPVQMAWADILAAYPVYMGHCTCRSAGVVDDLKQNGKVFNLLSAADSRRMLDRFVDRYLQLKEQHGTVPDTDIRYVEMCDRLVDLRNANSTEYCLENLMQWTYPDWEILPVHEKYTPTWIRSMHKNHKAHLLHKEMAFELATALYTARGTIFTSMKIFDTPYTICSCPTPENGGGCTLTNWYYYGMSNASLLPNTEIHGRRRADDGTISPCRHFPQRSDRECLGCGCRHDHETPRDFETILQQADESLMKYAE